MIPSSALLIGGLFVSLHKQMVWLFITGTSQRPISFSMKNINRVCCRVLWIPPLKILTLPCPPNRDYWRAVLNQSESSVIPLLTSIERTTLNQTSILSKFGFYLSLSETWPKVFKMTVPFIVVSKKFSFFPAVDCAGDTWGASYWQSLHILHCEILSLLFGKVVLVGICTNTAQAYPFSSFSPI